MIDNFPNESGEGVIKSKAKKKHSMTALISEELWEEFKKISEKNMQSIGERIRSLVEKDVENNK